MLSQVGPIHQSSSRGKLASRVTSKSRIEPFPHAAITWFLTSACFSSLTYSCDSFQATSYTQSWVSNLPSANFQ